MNAISLPSIPDARLPQAYMAAQNALAECQQIDECKEWADKAAALASYAKQSQDESLMKMAQRIKARAVRRAGELARQVMQPVGRPSDNFEGNHNISRAEVKDQSGFSDHQLTQATRIAAIPQQDFEAQVDGDTPPTLSALAQQGIKPRPVMDLKGRDPREFNRALHFVAIFEDYAREVERAEIDRGIAALNDSERAKLRRSINRIDAVHDQIMTRI
jgi:hypothetical protein